MEKRGLFYFIRNTSFTKFFVAWLMSIILFGIIYWLFSPFNAIMLESSKIIFSAQGLLESLYASFLIGTILGIVKTEATGIAEAFVYIQIAFSIAIILILVDKLFQKYVFPNYHLNTRQDKKINSLVLAMSIFRQDVDRIMHEHKSQSRQAIGIRDVEAIIDGLYVGFLDIEKLFSVRNLHRHKIKNVQYLMLTENIENCLEKLSKFIDYLEHHKMKYKDKSTEFWLQYILETADKIALNIDSIHPENPRMLIAVENIRELTDAISKKLQ